MNKYEQKQWFHKMGIGHIVLLINSGQRWVGNVCENTRQHASECSSAALMYVFSAPACHVLYDD